MQDTKGLSHWHRCCTDSCWLWHGCTHSSLSNPGFFPDGKQTVYIHDYKINALTHHTLCSVLQILHLMCLFDKRLDKNHVLLHNSHKCVLIWLIILVRKSVFMLEWDSKIGVALSNHIVCQSLCYFVLPFIHSLSCQYFSIVLPQSLLLLHLYTIFGFSSIFSCNT